MRRTLALALLLALPLASARAQQPPAPAYLEVVGEPPAPGSDAAKADLAIVLWEQQRRTADDVKRAKAEERFTLAAFAEALGPGFDPARYPRTAALLERAGADSHDASSALKKRFNRKRPFVAYPDLVHPAIMLEPSPSFPSGHATRSAFFALLLAQLAPERKPELIARGAQIAIDRVIGGVHWPSDIEAGQRLGRKLAEDLLTTDAYARAIAEVRAAEWSRPPATATQIP
jgi:hypothetical protein